MEITGYTNEENYYQLQIDGKPIEGLTVSKYYNIDEIIEATRGLSFELVVDIKDFIRKSFFNHGEKITFSLNRLNARIEETKIKIESYSMDLQEDNLTKMERNFYFTEISKSICELNVLNWIYEERILILK